MLRQFHDAHIEKNLDDSGALCLQASPIVKDQAKWVLDCANICAKLKKYERSYKLYVQVNMLKLNSPRSPFETHYDEVARKFTPSEIIELFPQRYNNLENAIWHQSPILIVGIPRSGTTMLERILDTLEGTLCVGEDKTLKEIFMEDQWAIKQGASQSPCQKTADDRQRLASDFVESYAITPSLRIIDKMPHNFMYLGYILLALPNTKVIHLRRDPRDVCWSINTHAFSGGHRYSYHFDGLVKEYEKSEQLMLH